MHATESFSYDKGHRTRRNESETAIDRTPHSQGALLRERCVMGPVTVHTLSAKERKPHPKQQRANFASQGRGFLVAAGIPIQQ